MPEIKHENQPSVPAPPPSVTTPKIAATLAAAGITEENLEAKLQEVFARQRATKAAEAVKEPDWTKITEEDAYNSAIYIPVIDHDIPDYMNMKLKDQEYMCVWASRDQRRIGQLLAEGYEMLKPEHVDPSFKTPLKFASDGNYEYADVVCMRVHKRILLSKRRRSMEISQAQLKRSNKLPLVKSRPGQDDLGLDPQIGPGMSLYDTEA